MRTALVVAFALPALSLAADLGRITIQSGVGEPLRAEIEVLSVAPNEAQSLAARIPPPEVFWRANIEPGPALKSVRASLEKRGQGRYVVTLRSSDPVLDPFMDLLVELTSPAGRAMREYTFLLEESGARRPPPVARSVHEDEPEDVRSVTRPIEVTGTAAPARADPSQVRVKPGDTLATIASAVGQRGVSQDQMVVALYEANQGAFLDRNMNLLRAGSLLAVPDDVAAAATPSDEARRIINQHRAAFDGYRRRLAAAVARNDVPGGVSSSQQRAGRTTDRGDTAAAPPAGDQLRLSQAGKDGGATATAKEDDIAAVERALAEAQERVVLLERSVQDMRSLLSLQNQQIAQLQGVLVPPNTGAGGAAAAPELNPLEHSARESSITRSIARALAWMSIGAAVVLLPIGGIILLRARNEQQRERMLRQATGRHRHKKHRRRDKRARKRARGDRAQGEEGQEREHQVEHRIKEHGMA